jgi:hypothetical protein
VNKIDIWLAPLPYALLFVQDFHDISAVKITHWIAFGHSLLIAFTYSFFENPRGIITLFAQFYYLIYNCCAKKRYKENNLIDVDALNANLKNANFSNSDDIKYGSTDTKQDNRLEKTVASITSKITKPNRRIPKLEDSNDDVELQDILTSSQVAITNLPIQKQENSDDDENLNSHRSIASTTPEITNSNFIRQEEYSDDERNNNSLDQPPVLARTQITIGNLLLAQENLDAAKKA